MIKKGWKDLLLSALAGVLLIVSSPGIDFWPAAFGSFAVLFWVFHRKRIKGWISMWLCGLVFYLITLAWIAVPMTVFGGAPAWAGFLLSVFTALVASLLFWAPAGFVMDRTKSAVLTALVFVVLELAKGKYFFGGLPWLNIAQTQHTNVLSLQLVSLIGEHGLSFIIIVSGAYLFKVVMHRRKEHMAALASLMVLLFVYGKVNIFLTPLPEGSYTARLVQTGIKQEDKWNKSKAEAVTGTLIDRVYEAAAAQGEYDLLILPESTFNVNPFTNHDVQSLINGLSDERPLVFSYDRSLKDTQGGRILYNSAGMLYKGELRNYDKMKLAPFGEYFPLEKYFYSIRVFFFGTGPLFTAGKNPELFIYEKLYMAPLICFESSFSELIRQRVDMGANVLVVLSNESWFGDSLGRSQRLAIDTLRAAEYGKYMLRITQDGISAVINPHGVKEMIMPEKKFHYADVTFSPMEYRTPFARFGYAWYLIVITAYAVMLYRRRKQA